MFKYSLKSLAFPAFIYCRETFDPGLLFVVLNSDERDNERVFWKYMSVDLLDSIDFEKDRATISFSPDEESFSTVGPGSRSLEIVRSKLQCDQEKWMECKLS